MSAEEIAGPTSGLRRGAQSAWEEFQKKLEVGPGPLLDLAKSAFEAGFYAGVQWTAAGRWLREEQ